MIFRKAALERLSSPEQLDQLIQVTDPRGWLALAALGLLLAAGVAWGILGSIPVAVHGEGYLSASGNPVAGDPATGDAASGDPARRESELLAVLFVPAAEAGEIRPGMEARLATGSPRGEAVRLRGRVAAVARAPSERPREIRVDVVPDPGAGPGYPRSRGPGGDLAGRGATPVRGTIVLRRERPFTLLISRLREEPGA